MVFRLDCRLVRFSLLFPCLVLLAACSGSAERDASVLPPLEVPPDLVKPRVDSRMQLPTLPKKAEQPAQTTADLPRLGEAVLPPQRGVHLRRDGDRRWLTVEAEPEQVWPLAMKFLEARGYRVARNEPAVGLLETDWKPVFADEAATETSPLRERLRLRIEPGERAGMSEVYVAQDASERAGDAWQMRVSDVERAAVMLNRFAQYLGGQDVKQETPLTPLSSKLDVDADGKPVLRVQAPFEQVWRRTALALEDLGFTIEDIDRSNHVYRVYTEVSTGKSEEELKYGKPESATVRDEYQVHVVDDGESTLIGVGGKSGEIESTQQGRHLLNLLQGQLK